MRGWQLPHITSRTSRLPANLLGTWDGTGCFDLSDNWSPVWSLYRLDRLVATQKSTSPSSPSAGTTSLEHSPLPLGQED